MAQKPAPNTDPTVATLDREQSIDLLQCMAESLPTRGASKATIVGTGAMLLLGLELEEPAGDLDLLYGGVRRENRGVPLDPRVIGQSRVENASLERAAVYAVTLYRERYPERPFMPYGAINNTFDGCKMMPRMMQFEHNLTFDGVRGRSLTIHIPDAQSLLATRLANPPRFEASRPLEECKDTRSVGKLLWLDGVDPSDPEAMLDHMLRVGKRHFKPDVVLHGPMRYAAQAMGVKPICIISRPLDVMCSVGAKRLVQELRSHAVT